jgi:hypothetical protein
LDGYRDEAVGILAKDSKARMAMTQVILRPQVGFGGEKTLSREGAARRVLEDRPARERKTVGCAEAEERTRLSGERQPCGSTVESFSRSSAW